MQLKSSLMNICAILAAILMAPLAVLSTTIVSGSAPVPTGLKNGMNICYMNALISCLHEVLPFKNSVYENFHESPMNRAFAGVFARKHLNMLPALDLKIDLIPAIEEMVPEWQFGVFQDIDEFFKAIFPYFSPSVQNSIGYDSRTVLTADAGAYVVSPGQSIRNPMIHVNLPEVPMEGLRLEDLVIQTLTVPETREYTLSREDHPGFFEQRDIDAFTFDYRAEIQATPQVIGYSTVIPVFVARRTQMTGSNRRDFRTDQLIVNEFLHLPLPYGSTETFILTNFAVYHPGHYLAYSKVFPYSTWYEFNDAQVTKVAGQKELGDLVKELGSKAVMLFYVKRQFSERVAIPEPVQNYALQSLITQHMDERLLKRISSTLKVEKKKKKKKSKSGKKSKKNSSK